MALPLIENATKYADEVALIDAQQALTFRQLLHRSGQVAGALLDDVSDLQEARVAYLVPAGCDYAAVQWGIWRAGGIAVPLGLQHPEPELAYVLDDAEATIVIADQDCVPRIASLVKQRGVRLITTDGLDSSPTPEMPHNSISL